MKETLRKTKDPDKNKGTIGTLQKTTGSSQKTCENKGNHAKTAKQPDGRYKSTMDTPSHPAWSLLRGLHRVPIRGSVA